MEADLHAIVRLFQSQINLTLNPAAVLRSGRANHSPMHTSSPSFTRPSVDLNTSTVLTCSTAISSLVTFLSTRIVSSKYATLAWREGARSSQ